MRKGHKLKYEHWHDSAVQFVASYMPNSTSQSRESCKMEL